MSRASVKNAWSGAEEKKKVSQKTHERQARFGAGKHTNSTVFCRPLLVPGVARHSMYHSCLLTTAISILWRKIIFYFQSPSLQSLNQVKLSHHTPRGEVGGEENSVEEKAA